MATPVRDTGFNTMTTPDLMHDLKEIDQLIAALRRTYHVDAEDLDDLSWLQGRRRYVLAVLAARRAQKGKRVVSLDLWRSGGLPLPEATPRAA
jgi:hypothetical protein